MCAYPLYSTAGAPVLFELTLEPTDYSTEHKISIGDVKVAKEAEYLCNALEY